MNEKVHYISPSQAETMAADAARAVVREALKDGPCGALVIAACAVGLLFAGWLLLYFMSFLSRGGVG